MAKRPLLLVSGFPRSGTTIMTRLLSSHADLRVSFEFHNLRVGVPYREYIRTLRKNWWHRRIVQSDLYLPRKKTKIESMYFFYYFRLLMLRHFGKTITADMVRDALYRIYPDALYVGDKWPRYIYDIEGMTAIEDCKRVVMYRDVHDVVPSYIKKFLKGTDPYDVDAAREAAQNWNLAMQGIKTHHDKMHLVRYEALLQSPTETMQALADYLEIDVNKFDTDILFDSNSGKYKSKLSDEQIEAIRGVASDMIDEWGYMPQSV